MPSMPRWNQFLTLLQSFYQESKYIFAVKWIDEDGDEITMSSQEEWSEAISSTKISPLKLYVTKKTSDRVSSNDKSQEKLPALVPEYFYSTKQESVSAEQKSHLQKVIPEIVSELMVNGVLPSWADDAIQTLPSSNLDTLFDVDIINLSHVLHKRAWALLNDSKTEDEEAVRLLRFCIALTPEDSVAHYNLACAFSRLNRTEEALTSLQNSLRVSDKPDFETIKNDEDLHNLRATEEFKKEFPQFFPPPFPVEDKKPEPVPCQFQDGFEKLHELGFMDDHVNGVLLEVYNGDVAAILQEQLQSCLF